MGRQPEERRPAWLRRQLAKLLRRHPATEEDPELLPVRKFAAQLNRAAEDLKGELTVDEAGFRWVGVQAHASAHDFVVFEALGLRRTAWDARPDAAYPGLYYRDEDGAEPVGEFIEALPPKRAAKIDDYVEEYLNCRPPEAPPPEFPITSQIEGELRELRVRFGNTRYRVLYQRSENLIVLLYAIEKDTGAVPRSAIELAKRRMADFRRRMDAERRGRPTSSRQDVPPKSRRSGG
jgi:phage-related protein